MIKAWWPAGKLSAMNHKSRGFTLLELLLVMTIISILVCVAIWGSMHMAQSWRLKRAGHQLLEDLKRAQGQAERSGSLVMNNGTLVMQRTFLVFDSGSKSYAAYTWRDSDGDGAEEADESLWLWQQSLPPGISFGWTAGIDRRACSNVNNPPGAVVSFSSPAYAPCNDLPCIKFDQHGFSVMGPGAIYLTGGEQSLAITGTRPGHFTLCVWDGDRWH